MIQKKVLEDLQGIGDTFNENKSSELHNSEISSKRPELSNSVIIYLIRFPSYVTRFSYFRFFSLKFPSYEKLAVTSQFHLTRFSNSVFQLGNLAPFEISFYLRNIKFRLDRGKAREHHMTHKRHDENQINLDTACEKNFL